MTQDTSGQATPIGAADAPPITRLEVATPDLARQNAAKLAELFPDCVTEGPEGNGPHIDFDLLKQALSGHAVDGPTERYRLDWPGKRQAMLLANTPTTKTLRPVREDSVDFDTTRNLFIEGDNLEALKILQETYLGKVKMIYIDPPYNTGKDFIYRDDFRRSAAEELDASGQADETGRLVANTEANGRFHSDWLSMMAPRLKLARSLLRDDGVIFVSIDENEVNTLHSCMEQIFGPNRFLFQLTILSNPKGRSQDKYVANCHDYILAFAKADIKKNDLNVPRSEAEISKDFPVIEEGRSYRLLELRNTHREFGKFNRPNLYYPLYVKSDGSVDTDQPGEEVLPIWEDGFEGCWTWGKDKAREQETHLIAKKVNGAWKIYRKSYADTDGNAPSKQVKSIWTDKEFFTERGQAVFNDLFVEREKIFQSPKPVKTIQRLISMSTESGDTVIDFFAGSGTTAHAVYNECVEAKKSLRFISVQIPELIAQGEVAYKRGFKTIAEVSRERIRRAGAKILTDHPEAKGTLDVGFRAFRIDSSNYHDTRLTTARAEAVATNEAARADLLDSLTSHIKNDRSDEDLLFGVLLAWGVDITLPIRRATVAGRDVILVDPPEDTDEDAALIACFAHDVDVGLAAALAALSPRRVVFRDDGFVDDATKENVASRFQQLSPDTTLRVL